jgi:hypothetical protein
VDDTLILMKDEATAVDMEKRTSKELYSMEK